MTTFYGYKLHIFLKRNWASKEFELWHVKANWQATICWLDLRLIWPYDNDFFRLRYPRVTASLFNIYTVAKRINSGKKKRSTYSIK